jgi:hypothetical protein
LKDIKDVKVDTKKINKYISKALIEFGWHERKSNWESNCMNIRLPFSRQSKEVRCFIMPLCLALKNHKGVTKKPPLYFIAMTCFRL